MTQDVAAEPGAALSFDLDPERYRGDLAEFRLTPEQEAELLHTLWSIMCSFVEMGFRADACGQLLQAFGTACDVEAEDGRIHKATAEEANSGKEALDG